MTSANLLYNAYLNFSKLSKTTGDITTKKMCLVGAYDTDQKIWYNGWALANNINPEYNKKSKQLLQYAIDIAIEPNDISQIIVRYIFTNSKLYIQEKIIQLRLIIAVSLFYMKAISWTRTRLGSIIYYHAEIH